MKCSVEATTKITVCHLLNTADTIQSTSYCIENISGKQKKKKQTSKSPTLKREAEWNVIGYPETSIMDWIPTYAETPCYYYTKQVTLSNRPP